MQDLSLILVVILYTLGVILLTLLIVLTIKTILAVNKAEKVLDNVNTKLSSFNKVFEVIDFTTDKIASVSEGLIEGVVSFVMSIFKKRKGDDHE